MDEENRKIHISDTELPVDFDLEDILAEYRGGPAGETPPADPESLVDRSRRLVMESMADGLAAAGFENLDGVIEDTVAEHLPVPAAAPASAEPEPDQAAEAGPETAPEADPEALTADQEALIDELARAQGGVAARELTDDDGSFAYASAEAGAEPPEEPEEPEKASRTRARGSAGSGRGFLSPVVAILALVALRRQKRLSREEQPGAGEEQTADETPEMTPDKAARHYTARMGSLKMRGRIAVGLCLIMIYLSYAANSALPLTGALGSSPRALALMLLILELSVIMTGLDVFTEGLLGLVGGKPGAGGLAAASCLFSIIDAAVLAVRNDGAAGLPFCAVSALSMTFAVWGAFFRCAGLRAGFRVLTSSKNLYTVTGENGIAPGDVALLKSRQSIAGFVRRSEAADYGENVFRVLTPLLLVAALVLGALASFAHGAPESFFHCVSALSAASAAFSATLCFALPFFAAARRFAQSGAAVAGWPGIRDIGRSRHVVITDADVFPKGTVEISNIRILEGCLVDKVITYTGSVAAASGGGLAAPFTELLRRNGCTLGKVENFEPHDGGGMTAMVNGENVCVGNTGFMNLMGIRVPRKISTKNSIYAAINGALVGIFTVDYQPVGSVQDALVLLLHSKLEPIFAIRDFNITPLMIKTKFKMPTDSFKFPAYAERYRISGAQPDQHSRVAAAVAREGMGPLVDTAERGRRLFGSIRAGTIIAAAGCVFGLLMMFLLCWTRSFDSATASNVITFMLLWLIPSAVIVWGVQR